MGRQHQGMDRPGVRQVPESSGEQRKMKKTGCKIICGAPTIQAVRGLMMMMMMMMMMTMTMTRFSRVTFSWLLVCLTQNSHELYSDWFNKRLTYHPPLTPCGLRKRAHCCKQTDKKGFRRSERCLSAVPQSTDIGCW